MRVVAGWGYCPSCGAVGDCGAAVSGGREDWRGLPVTEAVRPAKLTGRGMPQPSFVPPCDIRRLRDCARLRADLVHGRARCGQRLEKLLERALVKVSPAASTLDTGSVRAMLEALIAGQRNPEAPADLATGKMRARRREPAEAPDGKSEDRHAGLARMLLDQTGALTAQIGRLSARPIPVIIFRLPAGPAARFNDPGPGYYDERTSAGRKIRSHVRQLEALGLTVTLTASGDAAWPDRTETAARPSPSARPGP